MIQLYNADALDILPTLGHVDAVITDPPYGDGSYDTDKALPWEKLLPLSVKSLAIFGYPERMVAFCVTYRIIPDEWITWWPTNKPAARTNRMPRSCEVIAVFGETPGARLLMRPRVQNTYGVKRAIQRGLDPAWAQLEDVWRDAAPGMAMNHDLRQHPNEKPVTLMEKIVILCSRPGDVVVDFTMGSGTTGVACVRTGRNFIGIEISPEYYKIAERRIREAEAQPSLLTAPPETFATAALWPQGA